MYRNPLLVGGSVARYCPIAHTIPRGLCLSIAKVLSRSNTCAADVPLASQQRTNTSVRHMRHMTPCHHCFCVQRKHPAKRNARRNISYAKPNKTPRSVKTKKKNISKCGITFHCANEIQRRYSANFARQISRTRRYTPLACAAAACGTGGGREAL